MLDFKVNGKEAGIIKDDGNIVISDKGVLKDIEDALNGKPLDLEVEE